VPLPSPPHCLHWINASCGHDVQLIAVEDVRYFQSDAKYTRVVAIRRQGLIRMTLKELIAQLDGDVFRQVHRATLVNLSAVESVGHDDHGHMVLRLRQCADVLHVSQPYTHSFRKM